jgi:hypothetical protein
MTSVHPSDLVLDKHYDVVSTSGRKYAGRYTGRQLIGRPYDPDVILWFILPGHNTYSFVWNMQDTFYEVPAPASAAAPVAATPTVKTKG